MLYTFHSCPKLTTIRGYERLFSKLRKRVWNVRAVTSSVWRSWSEPMAAACDESDLCCWFCTRFLWIWAVWIGISTARLDKPRRTPGVSAKWTSKSKPDYKILENRNIFVLIQLMKLCPYQDLHASWSFWPYKCLYNFAKNIQKQCLKPWRVSW